MRQFRLSATVEMRNAAEPSTCPDAVLAALH